MLFNSYFFIFAFLPVTLLGFHLIGKLGHHRVAISWLVGASLFFYGWWNPSYLGLILISILFNYGMGISLLSSPKKSTLYAGIIANLLLLGYFKYTNFFIDNINSLLNTHISIGEIILPLAISFFTFQQITYLVDAYRGETKEYNFLHYCLFVTFFPQLIAGPIVHHREMLPQFARDALYRLKAQHLAVGFTIFIIGLFKKVVIADNLALHATPVFDAAEQGLALTMFEAWGGALAYTLQLYFDFSGYSEMALGIARMFGIRLPANFFSPYKATNIIDFWRRWHMTLSRFLRDYLYIPLGGNRKGTVRRHVNLMITMLLGGLWHGAGWTFVIWGGMHGLFLVLNHAWHAIKPVALSNNRFLPSHVTQIAGRTLTFFVVVIAWVMFRAVSVDSAINIYKAMFAMNGIALPVQLQPLWDNLGPYLPGSYIKADWLGRFGGSLDMLIILLLVLFTWAAPNTLQWMRKQRPSLAIGIPNGPVAEYHELVLWRPTIVWAIVIGLIGFTALISMTNVSEFLYFQF